MAILLVPDTFAPAPSAMAPAPDATADAPMATVLFDEAWTL